MGHPSYKLVYKPYYQNLPYTIIYHGIQPHKYKATECYRLRAPACTHFQDMFVVGIGGWVLDLSSTGTNSRGN